MLSPHEFATLMLIKDATTQSDFFDQADLIALADREFITIGMTQASVPPRLTDRGHALLARLGAAA